MTGDAEPPDKGATLHVQPAQIPLRQAVSPYATGGGGVTFERRIAASYLGLLLTGEGALELGDGRMIVSVAFQQSPRVPVDDLVILAARPDELQPSLELAIGIRRAPNIVPSDQDTKKLMTEYVRALLAAPEDGRQHRLALVVAGHQTHAEQLANLAELARGQFDAPSFFALVGAKGKFAQELVDRLGHLVALVANGLSELGFNDLHDNVVQARTWELLSRLSVLMPRVEEPDASDWNGTRNSLVPFARGQDLVGAGHLLDRLETLAAQFAPIAATVDLILIRREVHSLLEPGRWRHEHGWANLDHLQAQARDAVRDHIGLGDRTFHLDRATDGAAVLAAVKRTFAVVVHGESGAGKSAVVLGAAKAAAANPDETQVVCLNLRHLPEVSLELVARLGCPLETLLSELSAPHRLLVIDGADAAAETRRETFVYLINAARNSGVRVVAIGSSEARRLVDDLLAEQLAEEPTDYFVEGLSDAQLGDIVASFPELARLAGNARSRELLRRLVVVDLLVRSSMSGLPLSDVDAMREIWRGLVRRREQRDRGLPEAREQVLLQLAARELTGGRAIDLVGSLDAAAVDGLQHDGLLRPSTDNPWQVIPDFAHDEVRRHAVARVLLANDNAAAELLVHGAPRWALAASTLACQAMLVAPDGASSPLRGRFGRTQAAFDALVSAGFGARWGDVPTEALLTLGDPGPLLADAWPELRDGDGTGLRRLLRLLSQRHRDANAIVDPVVAEPIVALLLGEATPWSTGEDVARTLCNWLLALVLNDTPAGHPLRVRLRERLVAACAVGEERLAGLQAAAAEARAARTPEEIEKEREFEARHRALFTEIGYGGRARKSHPQIPPELTDDTALELLALLGPDLGESGEHLLRRVAQDAPWDLTPAVEGLGTGRALASYGRGLLADLTEAYYLDDEETGSGFHEDGIRDHHWRSPATTLAAWHHGPFMALFRSDLRGGVTVLNRLLNHAALVRARALAGLSNQWREASEDDVDQFKTKLCIAGTPRTYVGDEHVWLWYRGTGVGPYPCMSALQALERLCDELVAADIPLDRVVTLLLGECENLAMLGLVVGLLVRHLDRAGVLLDPFLAEPVIWELEFRRVVGESTGLAADSEGVTEPERRGWSFGNVATWLVVHADPERADELRSIGDQLVAAAERIDDAYGAGPGENRVDGAERVSYVTRVRNWACALDRDRYRAYTQDGVTYVQSIPPDDVRAALQPGNEDLRRGTEASRLLMRYYKGIRGQQASAPVTEEELRADLVTAKDLLDNPPAAGPTGRWDGPTAVAAAALEAHLLHRVALPADLMEFAVETVLAVAEGAAPPNQFESEGSYFELGADRLAARALPLLLLPAATTLRDALVKDSQGAGRARVMAAGHHLAQAIANETRLHLARGLDAVWAEPCRPTSCHHELALGLAVESMRDCVLGDWDEVSQRHRVVVVGEPVAESLGRVAAGDVAVSRLDAAIRALGAAVAHDTCVQAQARELLLATIDAQRRMLLAHERGYDEHGSHALVTARALIGLATIGENQPLHDHVEAYADNASLLGSLLLALSAVAEETPSAAGTARRVWPDIMSQVLDLAAAGHDLFGNDYFGQAALAALIPTRTYEGSFMYRELESAPIAWTDALAWREAIEEWLSVAAGRPQCVDSLVGLVETLPMDDQVESGLPWVATIVLADVETVVRRSYLLAEWLIAIRSTATDVGALGPWQQLVDALVVAGDTTLAQYSG